MEKFFSGRGTYQDENMPDITTLRTLAMATRDSPAIDVSEAFEVLDEINSGWVSWFSRPITGNEVEIMTSMDNGETFEKVINGQFIQNVKELNDDPTIHLRYIIRSYISQIIPERSPKVYSVVITLSDKKMNYWSTEETVKLEWNEVSE